jgi:hypothetical protein
MADSWSGKSRPNTIWQRALAALLALCSLNFMTFMIGIQVLGGDALNGYAKNGHFYLKNHAQITEVSESVYNYSLWHGRSIFLTHPLAMLAAGILIAHKRR